LTSSNLPLALVWRPPAENDRSAARRLLSLGQPVQFLAVSDSASNRSWMARLVLAIKI
jgi:hypothetical protein